MEISYKIFDGKAWCDEDYARHVTVKPSEKYINCVFENLYLDETYVTEGTFRNCYFEDVEFSHKRHVIWPNLSKNNFYG